MNFPLALCSTFFAILRLSTARSIRMASTASGTNAPAPANPELVVGRNNDLIISDFQQFVGNVSRLHRDTSVMLVTSRREGGAARSGQQRVAGEGERDCSLTPLFSRSSRSSFVDSQARRCRYYLQCTFQANGFGSFRRSFCKFSPMSRFSLALPSLARCARMLIEENTDL